MYSKINYLEKCMKLNTYKNPLISYTYKIVNNYNNLEGKKIMIRYWYNCKIKNSYGSLVYVAARACTSIHRLKTGNTQKDF